MLDGICYACVSMSAGICYGLCWQVEVMDVLARVFCGYGFVSMCVLEVYSGTVITNLTTGKQKSQTLFIRNS